MPRERQVRPDPLEEAVRPARGRRARGARQTDHRDGADSGIQGEVAGVDRKAEPVHGAAGELDRGGHDVAAVHDRGRAQHDQQIAGRRR